MKTAAVAGGTRSGDVDGTTAERGLANEERRRGGKMAGN